MASDRGTVGSKATNNPMLTTVQSGDLSRESARARLGFPYSDDLFRRLVVYSSDRLEGEMMRFFAQHCDKFAVAGGDDEHRLEWTELHKRYEAILEKHLLGFCEEESLTMDDFMAKVLEAKDDKEASGVVETVIASADYEKFVALMKRRAALRALK